MEQVLDFVSDTRLLEQMHSTSAAERQMGWESWYKRDASTVLRYIFRRTLILGCVEHSEDILQDCFLIGFKNVSSGHYCEQGLSLSAYLVGIAKNLLREMARLQRRQPTTLSDLDDDIHFGVEEKIDDTIYLQEVVNCVREAYAVLPGNYQRVVEQIYREGKSAHEVAAETGKSAGNIRAISHRAVREIGNYLERGQCRHLSTEAIRACLEVL